MAKKMTKVQQAQVVAEFVNIKKLMKGLKEQEDALRKQILGLGQDVVKGVGNKVVITISDRKNLNRAALEAKFGKEAVSECEKTSTVTTLKVVAD